MARANEEQLLLYQQREQQLQAELEDLRNDLTSYHEQTSNDRMKVAKLEVKLAKSETDNKLLRSKNADLTWQLSRTKAASQTPAASQTGIKAVEPNITPRPPVNPPSGSSTIGTKPKDSTAATPSKLSTVSGPRSSTTARPVVQPTPPQKQDTVPEGSKAKVGTPVRPVATSRANDSDYSELTQSEEDTKSAGEASDNEEEKPVKSLPVKPKTSSARTAEKQRVAALMARLKSKHAKFLKSLTLSDVDAVYISREGIASFGGSRQGLITQTSKVHQKNGRPRVLLFPQDAWNPITPKLPGDSGFIFTARDDLDNTSAGTSSVFAKVPKTTPQMWSYCGEYEVRDAEKMMPQEALDLPFEVNQKRVEKIMRTGRAANHLQVHAELSLRKKGIPASKMRIEEEKDAIVASGKDGVGLTADYVWKSISDGAVKVKIVQLECVGYDEEFAERMNRTMEGNTAAAETLKTLKAKKRPKPSLSGADTSTRRPVKKHKTATAPQPEVPEDEHDDGEDESYMPGKQSTAARERSARKKLPSAKKMAMDGLV